MVAMTTTQQTTRTDHNIWMALYYTDPIAARTWLSALGFEEGILVQDDDGVVQHSEMLWPEGGRVMIATLDDGVAGYAPATTGLYVVCDDPDAVHERAVAVGAEVTRPPEDATEYTSRNVSLRDLEGTSWTFGTYAG